MPSNDSALRRLIDAIVAEDRSEVTNLLDATPNLASATLQKGASKQNANDYYLDSIAHYIYVGDTALHAAAAGYRVDLVTELLDHGADAHARNRRGAQPLHYAADGIPGSPSWNPQAQRDTIARLVAAGADPNAVDKSGVAPLHRAVRTRCAAAVEALLDGGANIRLTNGNGSTPMQLATRMTGRGGSGSAEAKEQQDEIEHVLQRRGG